MNRAIRFSALVMVLSISTVGCTSLQQSRDYHHRKRTYQAAFSSITFPTTRAHLYAALPPLATDPSASILSCAPFFALEHYRLDSEFGISMNVYYFHQPFPHLTHGSRHDYDRTITRAEIDYLLTQPHQIRRSPKDRICAASLTK